MKKLYLGIDLVEPTNVNSEILSLCMIFEDGDTFYYEFNDATIGKADINQINKLLFLNSDEPTIMYKSGEKNITYIKNTTNYIRESIISLLKYFYNNEEILVLGNFNMTAFDFIRFYNLIDDKSINLNKSYINLSTYYKILNLENILEEKVKLTENSNLLISTKVLKEIYDTINI